LKLHTKLFVIFQSMNREMIVVLKLHMKSLMILLSMGISVHFVTVESETGRELRSSEKTELSSNYVFLVSQCIHSIKGIRKGGVGVNPPLELDILQKLYYLRKEIKCVFAYFMFSHKSGLSSPSRNHSTTFCRPFVHYACSRSCSGTLHFIRNHCLYIVCQGRTQG